MANVKIELSSDSMKKSNQKRLMKKIVKWANSGMNERDIVYQLSIERICKDYIVIGKETLGDEFEIKLFSREIA